MPPLLTRARYWSLASSTIAATALLVPLITSVPASAAPCDKGSPFGCDGSQKRPGGGGGGTGGAPSAPSGPFEPPPAVGLNPDQGTGFIPVPGGDPVPAAPTLPDLIQQAKSLAELPKPKVHTAPDGKTYVKVRTSLWVEGFNVVRTRPINVGGRQIQATATPTKVSWDLGERKLTCDNAGSKDGKRCHYTYRRSSAGQPGGGVYNITATIVWSFSWTCTGACGGQNGGELGAEGLSSDPAPLTVSEIQTNTGQ